MSSIPSPIDITTKGTSHPVPLPEELDIESIPLDLYCYCHRCQYQRQIYATVQSNLQRGLILPLFLLYNVLIWVTAQCNQTQFQFSERAQRGQFGDRVKLVNEADLRTVLQGGEIISFDNEEEEEEEGQLGEALVYGVIRQHQRVNKVFNDVVGWSCLALFVWVLVIGLVCAVFLSGTLTINL